MSWESARLHTNYLVVENTQRKRELDAQMNSLKERRERVDAALQRLKREDDTLRAEDEELRGRKVIHQFYFA